MNKKFNTLILILFFLGFSLLGYSQVPPAPPPPPPVGLKVPIDDYIPFFIIFALIIGVICIYNKERSKILTP